MKKLSCLILCMLLILQMIPIPAFAAETEDPTETTQETLPSAQGETAPEASYGNATVLSGCRTIEAQVPLGGSGGMTETAISAFVYERNTGTVIYAYNPDVPLQPGTFAKIVAAIVAIENGNLDDKVTVKSQSFKSLPGGATTADPYLKEGEELTLRDLLYLMFLTWANDAAVTLAEHVAGTQEAFVKKMNDWVAAAGCTNTKFSDCHGLGSEGQSTTARDITRIIQEAMKNMEFRELFGANSYKVPETNKSEARSIKSLNYLKEDTYMPTLNYEHVTGGIAHYSKASGASLVCTAEDQGMSFTVVVMGCERTFEENGWRVKDYGNYEDATQLLKYAFENYKICRLLHEGQSLTQFAVAGGENQVVAQSHVSMDAILPKVAHLDNLILKYSVVGGGLTAPVEYDQRIATMQVWYRNSCVAETDLYSMSSVRAVAESSLDIQGAASRDDSNLTGFLTFIGWTCVVILALFAVYLIVNNVRRVIARNRRRRRRKSRRRSR